jgi:hypothetical protein
MSNSRFIHTIAASLGRLFVNKHSTTIAYGFYMTIPITVSRSLVYNDPKTHIAEYEGC